MEYYFKGSSKLKNNPQRPSRSQRKLNYKKKVSSVAKATGGLLGRSSMRRTLASTKPITGGVSSLKNSVKSLGTLRRVALPVVIIAVIIFSSSFVIREAYSYRSMEVGASSEATPDLRYVPTILTSEFTIKKNDSLYAILSSLGLDHAKITEITESAKPFRDLTRVREGEIVRVSTIDGRFERLEYLYGRLNGIYVEDSGLGSTAIQGVLADMDGSDKYTAGKFERPHTIKKLYASATINNSLYGAGVTAGIDPKVVMELTDIFAWDVDFSTDIRKGDKFSVLYESIDIEDSADKSLTGRVLGVAIENGGKSYSAIYYKDKDGRGGYYDEEGKSLERALLKSPLRYSRISSYFSKKRYHPILKKYRAHHGIDYAAPTGTPIEASGDGKVVFAGWKSGYGKYIVIRHNEKYTTAYGHLSRISKGVKKGARVAQGQVIGKVGSTGISTGPHLHYEVKVRGKVVNPLKIKSEPRRSIPREDMPQFLALNEEIGDKLLEGMVGSGSLLAKAE